MLSAEQIGEIKEHLERAQNPLFYYDNDADGLCSFVILRRFLGRGKGVAVRSFPELEKSYARKVHELKADYVFVLDKPVLSEGFVKEVVGAGLPLVWIDHHDLAPEIWEKGIENFFVYNPARNEKKSDEPVTYLCYEIAERKEDIWLAVMGCIADHYLPDFVSDFKEKYPEFWGDMTKKPFDAYYNTEIGKIAMALNFGLKDSVTNVVKLQNFLIACKNPRDVLEEVPANYLFRKRYQDIKKKYSELLFEAKRFDFGKLIFFEYAGEMSISADLANELSYRNPKKYVVVAYKKGEIANLSLRGKGIKKILEKVLAGVGGAGGGHGDAVGARIKVSDLQLFRDLIVKEIGNK